MSESTVKATLETPILKPSMQEFANFAKYIEKVEKNHNFALVCIFFFLVSYFNFQFLFRFCNAFSSHFLR